MRCLLEGNQSEFIEIPIPHGKVTIQVDDANPNYLFFIRNFWKTLGKQVQIKFGGCHLGKIVDKVDEIDDDGALIVDINPLWLQEMDTFRSYMTKSNRYAIVATFRGRDGLPHTIRLSRTNAPALHNHFLIELSRQL
jgi:hypothetical protein